MQRASWEDRFWSKVEKTPSCWLWHGTISKYGYGEIFIQRRIKKAHRVSYELIHGPIPNGLSLDHLCRVRHCVYPAHLEAVTIQVNIARGNSIPAVNSRKTHCQIGHALSGSNLIQLPTRRRCRICTNAYLRKWVKAHAK